MSLQSLTIDPDPARWRSLLADHLILHHRPTDRAPDAAGPRAAAAPPVDAAVPRFLGRTQTEWIDQTRMELLGTQAPGDEARAVAPGVAPVVIGTGHQASFWHPGVLAKYLALDAFAAALRREGSMSAEGADEPTSPPRARTSVVRLELVVDQDDNDPLAVSVPAASLEPHADDQPTVGGNAGFSAPAEPNHAHRPLGPLRLTTRTLALGRVASANHSDDDNIATAAATHLPGADDSALGAQGVPVGWRPPATPLPPEGSEADALRPLPDAIASGIAAMRRALAFAERPPGVRGAGPQPSARPAAGRDRAVDVRGWSQAHQVAEAVDDLRCRAFGDEPAPPSAGERRRLFASDLISTSLWRALLAHWRRDPVPAVQAYNRAVRAAPEAGVAALALPRATSDAGRAADADDGAASAATRNASSVELPLWVIEPVDRDGPLDDQAAAGWRRRRATWRDLLDLVEADGSGRLNAPALARGVVLVPRALLMTGLVRFAVCDLFIHGMGGGVYDRIAERWFADPQAGWSGPDGKAGGPPATLAPMTVVSATLWLPFDDSPPATEAAWRQAAQRARYLQFNLDRVLDLASARAEKQRLLAEMEAMPRRSIARRRAYEAIQTLNERLRDAHAPVLADAERATDDLARRLAERTIRETRTWPFPIYPRQALLELRDAIVQRFEVATSAVQDATD